MLQQLLRGHGATRMLDKVGQQIEEPRLKLYQPPSLAQLIVREVERVGIKGVQHRRSLRSHTLGRCDAEPRGSPYNRSSPPRAGRAAAICSKSAANLQPSYSQASSSPVAHIVLLPVSTPHG